MTKIKVFDTFSGVGGFSLSLKQALGDDVEIVGFSENDKWCNAVLKYHYPNIKNYGDITKINPEDLPDFDLLCGGYPCTDVSIAGSRDLSKGRTTLIDYALEIAKIKSPKYLLFENVTGMFSASEGKFIENLTQRISELGYYVDFAVFNSKWWGVSQNRQRLYFFCVREDLINQEKKKNDVWGKFSK